MYTPTRATRQVLLKTMATDGPTRCAPHALFTPNRLCLQPYVKSFHHGIGAGRFFRLPTYQAPWVRRAHQERPSMIHCSACRPDFADLLLGFGSLAGKEALEGDTEPAAIVQLLTNQWC